MTRELYDWHEDQRRRALKRENDLKGQARSMGTAELLQSLSWQQSLSEHFDEIGQGNNCGQKSEVIKAELRRRGHHV